MTNTFDLSRYSFLQPRFALFALWGSFIYSIGFPIISLWQGWDSIALSYTLLQSLPTVLLHIYYLLVLWKILQVQFLYREADMAFLLLILGIFLQNSHRFWQHLYSVSAWTWFLLELPAYIFYMLLIWRIGHMKEDLFGHKFFLFFTGFFLPIGLIFRSVAVHFSAQEISGGEMVLSGILVLFVFVHLLFLSRIFYSAYKTPHSPIDPAETLIDEIGQENLEP